jgi:creatinine amidohydrolase/Fe(II)-dependent formamide hydrolase-like protein
MRHVATAITAVLVVAAVASPLQAQGRGADPEAAARRRAEQERRLQEELRAQRPIEAVNSVWIEELTWMEVRDAIAAGKTTVIIPTGGIEQNGPYLATGKHNYVLQGACEGIARKLGDALCAPIIKLVPEGNIDAPSGMMRYPGTISLREETYRAVLDDVASSLKAHGFRHIIFIGDSGGNQAGMEAVAKMLNERWGANSAHFIPEFYRYADVFTWMENELGLKEPKSDGLHDDFVITSIMMVTDPTTVRYAQRVKAGKASINGLSIEPKEKTIEIGRKLLQFRVDETVKAIQTAIAGAR